MTKHDLNIYFSKVVGGIEQNYAENRELALDLLKSEYINVIIEQYSDGNGISYHVTIREDGKHWDARDRNLAYAICSALWSYRQK